MAYSRIKTWIPGEVLTSSDLNNEFDGNITNENDLDTRLTTEVDARTTLEAEHDALSANVWNVDHIADDKVTAASIADLAVETANVANSAITGAKVAAALKDPAADTAGLRTLGTGSTQACAGNDARLSDERTPINGSVTTAKLANAAVTPAKLKTIANTTGASGSLSGSSAISIQAQDYCFALNTYVGSQVFIHMTGHTTNTVDTVARIGFYNRETTSFSYAVRWRYMTATDHPFVYAIQDKITGKILHLWACDDPPNDYWGLNAKPKDFIPPIILSDGNGIPVDMQVYNEIVVFNYNKLAIQEINDRVVLEKKLGFEVLNDTFEFNKTKNIFTPKNLTQI